MTPERLKALIDAGADITLIDIREKYERMVAHIGGDHIPMDVLCDTLGVIPTDKEVVVYCNSGGRGAAVKHCLEGKGFDNVANLEGGLNKWRESVNPDLPTE